MKQQKWFELSLKADGKDDSCSSTAATVYTSCMIIPSHRDETNIPRTQIFDTQNVKRARIEMFFNFTSSPSVFVSHSIYEFIITLYANCAGAACGYNKRIQYDRSVIIQIAACAFGIWVNFVRWSQWLCGGIGSDDIFGISGPAFRAGTGGSRFASSRARLPLLCRRSMAGG